MFVFKVFAIYIYQSTNIHFFFKSGLFKKNVYFCTLKAMGMAGFVCRQPLSCLIFGHKS